MTLFLGVVLASTAAAPRAYDVSRSAVTATVSASIELRLKAPPDRAFVMFDPVNESRWDPDWKPAFRGDGRVAAGLAFVTKDGSSRTTWLLDRFDRAARTLRYVVLRRSTLDVIDVSVVPDGRSAARATVTYTRTALDKRADAKVRRFAAHFGDEAPHWETAINGALTRSGKP